MLEGWGVETPQPLWVGLVLVVARSAAELLFSVSVPGVSFITILQWTILNELGQGRS